MTGGGGSDFQRCAALGTGMGPTWRFFFPFRSFFRASSASHPAAVAGVLPNPLTHKGYFSHLSSRRVRAPLFFLFIPARVP